MGTSLLLLCPTLKCHIQFSRHSIVSLLMCKVLVKCCDYLGAFQPVDPEGRRRSFADWVKLGRRQVVQRVGCGSPTEGAHILHPQKRNAYHSKRKRQRQDWQVEDNLISICYHEIVVEYNWLSKRCSAVIASLSFSTHHLDQFVCTHYTLTEEHRLKKQRLFGKNSTCPQAVVSHN